MVKIYRLRRALFVTFLALGFAMATWVVRTPSIRDALDASTLEMGLILFGFSVGSMGGILTAAKLVAIFGAHRCVTGGLTAAMAGLTVLAAGTEYASLWIAGLGLGLVGLGMAVGEVSVNILGAHVEQRLRRTVLTAIHGCFSLGTAIGAVVGLGVVSFDLSAQWHLIFASVLLAQLLIYVFVGVRGFRCNEVEDGHESGFFRTIKKDPKLLLVGLIVLAVALSEGAANDWLPLLIVDSHGVEERLGLLVFLAFAVTMTVGRFVGERLVNRFGPVSVMRVSGFIGAAGILAVIIAPNVYIASAAVILWAAGAALGFPVAMSAGAANGPNASARISVLATIGYTAFLVGPPLLGFVGEEVGLRLAMLIVLALQVFPVLLAASLSGPKRA